MALNPAHGNARRGWPPFSFALEGWRAKLRPEARLLAEGRVVGFSYLRGRSPLFTAFWGGVAVNRSPPHGATPGLPIGCVEGAVHRWQGGW
jgi:hypothetical protein